MLVFGAGAMLAVDPIPQDATYHLFADARAFLGVPNFANVVSNAGFAVVGVMGLLWILRRGARLFPDRSHARPYRLFFVGVGLVSLGSAYYHWAPSNETLLWDRLPMAVAFMSLSSAVVADRVHARAGNGWLLALLVALGLASLLHWHWTESIGRGDLRLYALVQFYPMLAIPVICLLFPERHYTAGRYIAWIIGWYGLSKLLEFLDHEVFALSSHLVSGHTLKHIAAAVATYVALHMLVDSQGRSARRS